MNTAMTIPGSRCVVTGASRGIGRAIATALVNEGARVVVNDLEATAVQRTADDIGAIAVAGDAASEQGVSALIEAATSAMGGIDLFVANAGVGTGLGLDATDDQWAATWDVNVMAHVRAARILVPKWLDHGGRFVVTASAAGLLTMIGDAPYSVTKHGAVAFAEWLSSTYGHRGIVVQALCPQGVRTDMYETSGPLKAVLDRAPVIEPTEAAQAVIEALGDDRFLILPHPEVRDYYSYRAARTDDWLAGMRGIQQSVQQSIDDARSGGS